MPYVKSSAKFGSKVVLLTVPQVPEAGMYGAAIEEIQELRQQEEARALEYLENIASILREDGLETEIIVTGSRPAQTIISVAEQKRADVIMMATHGRGGLDRLLVGSVAERVVQNTDIPVFLVPKGKLLQENS